jgi:Zn-dependent peptidase ImmA (M78 family)
MDTHVARRALRGALEVRKKAKVALSAPLCIYDLASERLKIEVRFQAGATFGGMYAKETETILVPSERPAGRRRFTCAHEVGHWYFGHGTKVEDLEGMEKGGSNDPDEILANQFAGHLLMPRWAVEQSFADRKLVPETATDRDLYALACQFGVGYRTIITHLRYALNMISPHRTELLLRSSRKAIKQKFLSETFSNHLVFVDSCWKQEVAVDLEVGDEVLLTFDATAENDRLRKQPVAEGTLLLATKPGITKVSADNSAWTTFVRICRKGFTGRSIYRHLEDPDVE